MLREYIDNMPQNVIELTKKATEKLREVIREEVSSNEEETLRQIIFDYFETNLLHHYLQIHDFEGWSQYTEASIIYADIRRYVEKITESEEFGVYDYTLDAFYIIFMDYAQCDGEQPDCVPECTEED